MIAAIGLLLHAVVASAQAAGPGANTPDGVAGTWEVREVAVDHQDQQHWRFRPNDPQLVGRTLSIEHDRVKLNFSKDLDCAQTSWKAKPRISSLPTRARRPWSRTKAMKARSTC